MDYYSEAIEILNLANLLRHRVDRKIYNKIEKLSHKSKADFHLVEFQVDILSDVSLIRVMEEKLETIKSSIEETSEYINDLRERINSKG
ncbi:MAG: hypothetical protein ABIJ40_14450 [Bacteroidota bacterium]